jgi:hypothetical protein
MADGSAMMAREGDDPLLPAAAQLARKRSELVGRAEAASTSRALRRAWLPPNTVG